MTSLPPSDLDPRAVALFLDYDGTLVRYASDDLMNPKRDPDLPGLLAALAEATAGAVALVSGRGIGELDGLVAPARVAASGTHGAELRRGPAEAIEVLFRPDGLAAPIAACEALAAEIPGLDIEIKHLTFVLHFHRRREREAEIVDFCRRLCADRPDLVPALGHGLVEFKPAGGDKGVGIARLMERAPFAGRRPVFLGDDIPDEAGFALVDRLGGVSIRVGAGESGARHRLADPAAVRAWLAGLLAA